MMNIQGYASLDSVIDKSKKPLSPSEFNAIANDTDAIIIGKSKTTCGKFVGDRIQLKNQFFMAWQSHATKNWFFSKLNLIQSCHA
jgi:hypothetical protein